MTIDQDLIIIGAGGAGLSAAQYGARGNLRTLVLEELSSGGQALLIDTLENHPGFPQAVSGFDFTQKMEEQAKRFGAKMENGHFVVETDHGRLTSLAVILATVARHRTLGAEGEGELAGKGVSYCAPFLVTTWATSKPTSEWRRECLVHTQWETCGQAHFVSWWWRPARGR